MADIKYISFKTAISYWKEAIRELPGYQPEVDDGVERKALLNKEKTFLNKVMVAQECMKSSTDNKNQIQQMSDYYYARYGKQPKKNTRIMAFFMAMPRDYITADYGLTGDEFKALCTELAGKPGIDWKVLKNAQKKILSRTYTESELERIYDFFEKAVPVICKVLGIRTEDVLYAVVHMDESFAHIHIAAFPAVYIHDLEAWQEYQGKEVKGRRPKTLLGDTNRVIGGQEMPVGCSRERFDKRFLFRLNKNLEAGFKELGIEAHIANGKGQINDVQKTGKEQRRVAAIVRGIEEETKRRSGLYEKQKADQDAQISKNEATLKAQEAELTQNRETIKELQQEIRTAKTELKGLKKAIQEARGILRDIGERIGGLIQTGIDKIKKAKSHKDREEAEKEAKESLLRIQTDAVQVLNAFMPFDEEEEKVDLEEEYDEERGDI